MLQSVALLAEGDDVEVSVGCGHVCFHAPLHERFLLEAVGDEVADADDLQSVLASHLLQLGHAGHGAVFVQNLDEGCSRLQTREASQIDSSLGVSGTTQDALVLGIEGIDVSGTAEVGRLTGGVGQCTDGGSAVVSADACSAAFQQVHGDGEGCAEHAGVVLHLMFQFEFLGAADGDGCAEHAAAVAQHEVHLLGGYHLGSCDEVAFVLAVFIVHDDDELSLAEVGQRLLYGVQFKWLVH